jgi:Cu+-exporting ATPase
MALEPRTVPLEEEDNRELKDMTRRFWIGVLLTVPLVVMAMGRHVPGMPFDGLA